MVILALLFVACCLTPHPHGRQYNICTTDTNGSGAGQYSICTIEAILDNCFTRFVFYGFLCFPVSNTLTTLWKKMGIAEDGDFAYFWHRRSRLFFYFLLIAEITAWPMGKIRAHTPIAEWLIGPIECL